MRFVFALLLVYIWSANIISSLTGVEESEPINDFEDLLGSDFKYGVSASTSTETFLNYSTSKTYQEIYKNILNYRLNAPDMASPSTVLQEQRVLQGEYVYIEEEYTAKHLVATHCDVVLMDEILYTVRYAVGLQRNSAYKPLVNRITSLLHESGMFDDLLRKLYLQLETCDRDRERRQISLGVNQLRGIFVCFGATIACCAVVLLYELGWFTLRRWLQTCPFINDYSATGVTGH